MNKTITQHLDLLDQLLQKKNTSRLNEKLFDEHVCLRPIFNALEKNKIANDILILDDTLETYIIGDIHADYASLSQIMKRTHFKERYDERNPVRLVFLGDYVDRGKKHLETLLYLLQLKTEYPHLIHLLKGNHDGGVIDESGNIQTPYRIPEEDNPLDYFPFFLKDYLEKNARGDLTLLKKYLAWFDSLPLTAFIGLENGSKIYECVHGGIPKPDLKSDMPFHRIKCLSDLTHRTKKDDLGHTTPDLMVWSDPHQGEPDLRLNMKRFKFTEEQFNAYANTIGIDALFRGHQVVKDGLQSHFGGKVYTIFSSGNTEDTYYTQVSPKILHLSKGLYLTPIPL